MSEFEEKVRQTLAKATNQGEMTDADSVGTVGSPDCGDMLRLWLKFKQEGDRKVIDKASFQAFGCQTAMAVAAMATEVLKGKSLEEASQLSAADLTGELGPRPPMKIHCGQLVEGALQGALGAASAPTESTSSAATQTLASQINQNVTKPLKIKFKTTE